MLRRIKEIGDGRLATMFAESDEDWAVENGYSVELYEVELAEDGYHYLAGSVPETSLDELKTKAQNAVESKKDAKLAESCVLDVEGVGQVIYNQQAIMNVSSLLVMGVDEATNYILANDEVVAVTPAQLVLIAQAFRQYVESIYEWKIGLFAALDVCESAEALNELELD